MVTFVEQFVDLFNLLAERNDVDPLPPNTLISGDEGSGVDNLE